MRNDLLKSSIAPRQFGDSITAKVRLPVAIPDEQRLKLFMILTA
eukprot:CAMPEP_0184682786 /NCGR_PEP_ID=MMETSP0312-20130426/8753_1 /TAXON_ID=31354 /ORGANISM="Compsopogon coeruleus, Strain SAG 36.94" /LENGTH=43 /DNA_ID= /DNA_START= /DNA_END= /DNA_ORIENTATION=